MTLLSIEADGGTNGINRKCDPLQGSCVSKARYAGQVTFSRLLAQPSA